MAWSTFIGGAVGAVFGGPLGAAVGAAIGAGADAWLEDDGTSDAQNLEANLQLTSDPGGLILAFSFAQVPAGSVAIVTVRDEDGGFARAAVEQYADEDGDFRLIAEVDGDGDTCVFLPTGSVISPNNAVIGVRALAVDGDDYHLLGETFFEAEIPTGTFSLAEYWRPLIGLCMTVARADGVLDRTEVRAIRRLVEEELELPSSERNNLKSILKREPSRPCGEMLMALAVRVPDLEKMTLLATLAEVAHADGKIHPAEVDEIKNIACLIGLEEQWEEISEDLGLNVASKVADALKLLGLAGDTTTVLIKKAYRAKVVQYHPDKYQNLPIEFRDVAREKTAELTAARDLLLERR